MACVAPRLFSSFSRKPLPLCGTIQMAKSLKANRFVFFKTLDETVNSSRRVLVNQAPTLQSVVNRFSADYCPLVSFLSSLPFCDQSFSKNHLDLLHKEFSPSRRWCHTSKSQSQCWSCGKTAGSWPFLVCEACRSVQPMDLSVDYFQIFGLERTYEIKDNNLEGKYKDWQKKLHPDLVHSKSEKERAFAAEQSARVIDAYHTLSKPLSRALYLLLLEGVHVDEEKTLTDPDVLTEMMEIREVVEEASDSDTLKQIQSQIQTKLDNWSNAFREAVNKRNFEDAITSVQRMRYYDRAIEAIVKKL